MPKGKLGLFNVRFFCEIGIGFRRKLTKYVEIKIQVDIELGI